MSNIQKTIELAGDGANVIIGVSPTDLQEFALFVIDEFSKRVEAERKSQKEDKKLSAREAGKWLGVSPATLWRWNRSGYLKSHKLGNKTFYLMSDLLAL